MKFIMMIFLLPVLLVPLAAIGLNVLACDMHVTAVDGMRNKQASIQRRGWFYSYCNFMANVR